MKIRLIPLCLILIGTMPFLSRAQDHPIVNWIGKDIKSADVKIPAADRPTIVAFVRAGQEQSSQAIQQIQSTLADPGTAQVVLVLSGPDAADSAKTLASNLSKPWPIVADTEFTASGKMGIHVWPTVLVIKSDGTQVAHLAGIPTDLAAYLAYASGKLDDAGLQKRLASKDVVTDSPAQTAERYVPIAQRLLEQGQVDQAQVEVGEGLKLAPQDPTLLLLSARIDVMSNKPRDAIAILDKLPPGAAPAWETTLLRGKALIALEKWPEAKTILPEALKLNPDPSEAHYLLGLCYQHDQDWQHAAEQFRQAYERSAKARQ